MGFSKQARRNTHGRFILQLRFGLDDGTEKTSGEACRCNMQKSKNNTLPPAPTFKNLPIPLTDTF
jgi:hypothetical protein